MLNIFRTIRQRLAAQNKVAAYLRYAIGEILLVVIGILIALQVNNWNEERKKAIEEQKALVNLKQDFKYNHDQLIDLIRESDSLINANLMLLNHTGNKYHMDDVPNLDSLLSTLGSTPIFYPKNGFLDDLLNSGKLGIFRNVDLRQLLSSWKPTLEYLKKREIECTELSNKIEDFITAHGSWVNYDHKYGHYDYSIPPSGFETNNNELLLIREFENYIDNHIYYINYVRTRQKATLEVTEKILQLIEKELKK